MSAPDIQLERSKTAEIAGRFQLTKPAVALLTAELTPGEFAATLLAQGHFNDAIQFVAHALTARDGVWWACQCARQSTNPETTRTEEAAIVAAERWVTELTDETRRDALNAANAAGVGTAAGSVAIAVFHTGGSLAPPDSPPVNPKEFASAPLVAGSVILATIHPDPAKRAELTKEYVRQGTDLYTASQG
jgi:hypothetical protein